MRQLIGQGEVSGPPASGWSPEAVPAQVLLRMRRERLASGLPAFTRRHEALRVRHVSRCLLPSSLVLLGKRKSRVEVLVSAGAHVTRK